MPPHTCCAVLCCCLCPSPDVTRWRAACSKQSAVHDAQLLYHDLMSPPSRACVPPGLVFYDPKPRVPSHAEPALGMLFCAAAGVGALPLHVHRLSAERPAVLRHRRSQRPVPPLGVRPCQALRALVWTLSAFLCPAFLQSDRQFCATDAANGLHRTSVRAPWYHTSCHWVLQMFPAADEHGACWLQSAPFLLFPVCFSCPVPFCWFSQMLWGQDWLRGLCILPSSCSVALSCIPFRWHATSSSCPTLGLQLSIIVPDSWTLQSLAAVGGGRCPGLD